MKAYMRWPGGVGKALTFSYDDGVREDIRLIEMFDKFGVKGTFNINSGCFSPEVNPSDKAAGVGRMTRDEAFELYANSNHEVAVHTVSHPHLATLPPVAALQEVLKDREALESLFSVPITGMAYPYGSYDDKSVEQLRAAGISYARTTRASRSFVLPKDWLRLFPTCHHSDSELMILAEKFTETEPRFESFLFYVWGHSYEFTRNNNWELMEDFLKVVSDREDVWYATNIEIYDYINAFEQLRFSADSSAVRNMSGMSVWFSSGCGATAVEIKPGELLHI